MTFNDIRNEVNERCKGLVENLYIISLQEKEISKCHDIFRWAHIMQTHEYYLLKSHVGSRSQLTTRFTGIDNGHRDDQGRMLLFESSVCGYHYDGPAPRYATWDEAEKGHYELYESLKDKYING